jgi:hypothetical protein
MASRAFSSAIARASRCARSIRSQSTETVVPRSANTASRVTSWGPLMAKAKRGAVKKKL